MYIYVVVLDQDVYERDGPGFFFSRFKSRIEQASGEPCLTVFYRQFNLSLLNELQPRAVVMSGFGRRFQDYQVEWFLGMAEVMHKADLPMLCICGSHQLLGFTFNQDLRQTAHLEDEPMRLLGYDEDLPHQTAEGACSDLSPYYLAKGFFPIRRVKSDPLFAGLPGVMMMHCWHYCEVKRLPAGFEILASSNHCRIESMRHVSRPLYGIQFHAEAYEAPYHDGRQLLANFFQIAQDFWRSRPP